jgi:archaemetzincin
LAVTAKDICILNEKGKEWGIFGLGNMPGYQAVVSSYRLGKRGKVSRAERLARVAVHELGHNLGLRHCPKACVMSDAEGAIRSLDDWPEFCGSCAGKLGS